MKKIAVIGAGGMLGYAVGEYFERKGDDVTRVTRAEYDIARDPIEKLSNVITDCRYVVNCAGVIKPQIASTPIEDVFRVNAIFPRNLAKLADSTGSQVFHVTTDCVYSGTKGGYTENDLFDADDVYGMSKNSGDTADNMTLRTSIIGEEKGQSRSLLEWARSQAGKEVNGFLNHHWNGVTTLYLAEIIETIIDRDLYEKGIFHVHSPDTVNKYELVSMLSEVYGLNLTVNPIEVENSCDRDLGSIHELSSKVSTKTIRQQIQEMRSFFT